VDSTTVVVASAVAAVVVALAVADSTTAVVAVAVDLDLSKTWLFAAVLLPLQEATVGHQPFHLESTLPMCSPLRTMRRSRLSRTSWYCQQKAR